MSDMVFREIKKWIERVDKDIKENRKRPFNSKEFSDGSIVVSRNLILYSPEDVRKMLIELLGDEKQ